MSQPAWRPALLIFDLDGTLVDSLDDIATGINLARAEFGLPALERAAVLDRVGNGAERLVREAIPVGRERQTAALAAYLRHYEAHLLDRTRLLPGAEALLARLAGRALAVVTNKPQRLAECVLEGLGVRGRFRAVLGGDALPQRKPHPAPLLHVLRACGVAPGAALMIGDGVNDVLAAQAAGVPIIALTGGLGVPARLRAMAPDRLVPDLAAAGSLID
jgi:phosphoglycolate phosphatase